MVLTQVQKNLLNRDILEYLVKEQYKRTAVIFAEEISSNLGDVDPEGNKLEMKWKSILSLQKKINNLEEQLRNVKEQLEKPQGRKLNNNQPMEDLYILKTPAKFQLTGHQNPITCLAFHPHYTQLASCSDDYTIKMWEFQTGEFERSLKGHTSAVNCVNFDSQGRFLVSSSSDLSIKLWDLNNDYVCFKTLFGHDHNISQVAFIENDDSIISCSRDKTIRLWEIRTGFCKRTFLGHDGWVRNLTISRDNRNFATVSEDQSVIIWDISKQAPLNRFMAHDNVIEALAFIEGESSAKLMNSQFLKSKFTQQVRVNALKQLSEQGTTGMATYFQMFILTGGRDKLIKLFVCQTGELLFTFHGHDNWVRSIVVHSSGRYLYSASDDKTIRIWDLNFGKEKKKIDAHDHFISSIRFNAKYGVIASAGNDKAIKIWQLKSN